MGVGGMSEKTTKQALSKHFADVAKPKLVDMMKKGKAVLAYEKEEDVAAAVAAMNGTELDGNTLEVDVWAKPEKKPREKKGKAKESELKCARTTSTASESQLHTPHVTVVDEKTYDKSLLERCKKFAADGQVGYPEAKLLWKDAMDDGVVTDI